MDKAARGRGSRSDAETRGEEKYVIEEIHRFFLFFFLLSFVRKFFEDARRCVYIGMHRRRRRNDSIFVPLIAQLFASAI